MMSTIVRSAAETIFYVSLVLHSLHFRNYALLRDGLLDRVLLSVCENVSRVCNIIGGTETAKIPQHAASFDAWVDGHGKGIFYSHVVVVIFAMGTARAIGSATGTSTGCFGGEVNALLYALGTILVFLLWECGKNQCKGQLKLMFYIFLHHIGAVIAFLHQAGETPDGAWQNFRLFSWLWICHGFGMMNTIYSAIGLPKKHEHRALKILRYLCAAVSVYNLYSYLNGDTQPGLGQNYQTLAAVSMITGRFLVNSNWYNVEWMRHVEGPGFIFVILAHLVHRGHTYPAMGVAAAVLFQVIQLYVKVYLTQRLPEPPLLSADINAEMLVLTEKTSGNALVFEHHDALRAYKEMPLTLSAPPGYRALVQKSETVLGPYMDWSIFECGVARSYGNIKDPLNAAPAIKAVYDEEGFLTRAHDGRVLDIVMWQYVVGTKVILLRDQYGEKTRNGHCDGGRSFVVNSDGTISPRKALHLCLGVQEDKKKD